jgi:exodeoxyribonuclease III
MLKIATWNVNSLRVRLPQVLDWLQTHSPDILALQEIKLTDPDFPLDVIRAAGYAVTYSGQKTYNGVAILSRTPGVDVVTDFPVFADPQRRILGMTINGLRILNLYVPNGESLDSPKYAYKLEWLEHLHNFLLEELKKYPHLVILGDFNIAPTAADVHDPALWEGRILCSEKERGALQKILQLGLEDCFRIHPQAEKSFSWWDYRLNAFKRNMGLRIDHIFASKALAVQCRQCYIDKTPRGVERPSDHALVVAEFD